MDSDQFHAPIVEPAVSVTLSTCQLCTYSTSGTYTHFQVIVVLQLLPLLCFLHDSVCIVSRYGFHGNRRYVVVRGRQWLSRRWAGAVVDCCFGGKVYVHALPQLTLEGIIPLCSELLVELLCFIALQITADPQHMKHEDFVKHFTTEETKYIRHLDMLIKVCIACVYVTCSYMAKDETGMKHQCCYSFIQTKGDSELRLLHF